jgi:hypothetical protein
MSTVEVRGTPREPLYDLHPVTGASIEVFYADRDMENVWEVRGRLVLVLSAARLCPGGASKGAVRDQVWRISERPRNRGAVLRQAGRLLEEPPGKCS